MTGRERIMAMFKGEMPDRQPWVPYVGVHAGKLCGMDAKTLLSNHQNLLKGLYETKRVYQPDGLTVTFDLQLEAEALGCKLKWYEDSPPSVIGHPMEELTHIPAFRDDMLTEDQGRIGQVLQAARALTDNDSGTANYGLVCGPVTLASHMRGERFLIDLILDVPMSQALIAFTSQVTKKMCRLYSEAGTDIIAVVDPMMSQISPNHLESFCGSHYTEIFQHIRELEKHSALFVCGNATGHLQHMCRMSPDMLSLDEHTNFDLAMATAESHGILVSGNVPVSTLMLHGTPEENRQYVEIFTKKRKPFILASGCDIPYDTPEDNIRSISEFCAKAVYSK